MRTNKMNINKPQKYLIYFSSLIILLTVLFPPVKFERYYDVKLKQELESKLVRITARQLVGLEPLPDHLQYTFIESIQSSLGIKIKPIKKYKFINSIPSEVELVRYGTEKGQLIFYKVDVEKYIIQLTGVLSITFLILLGISGSKSNSKLREASLDNKKDEISD